jgi:sulfatase maturation enzyme AslB (radical SAM superfamily)
MGQNVLWFEKKDGDSDLSNFLNKITHKDPFTQLDQLPLSLELRLGNQCNLQCISCWGMSSSLVQSERLDILDKGLLKEYNLEKIDKKWKEETDIVIKSKLTEWYETDMFYENFRKMAPKLKRLYTTGGEPTVIKANYKILEMLLEAGNKSCSVEFTSNMTTWNNKFYDALAQFENVEIQMSIDGVDEIGEYIRYPSNFKIVRENMFKAVEMASDNPNWKIKCYTVLQALNYKHLVPIWELLTEVAATYQKKIDWWPITLSSPEHLSLSSVPMQERLDYIPEIIEQSMRFRDPSKAFSVSSSTVGAITDSLTNMTYNYELNNTFNNYVRFLNDYRKKNDS